MSKSVMAQSQNFGWLLECYLLSGSSLVSWKHLEVHSFSIHGKNLLVQQTLTLLRANGFPNRRYAHDDFLGYLARIENNSEYSEQVKTVAKQMEFCLQFLETVGIRAGMRGHAAAEEALNLYSPQSKAPVLGSNEPHAPTQKGPV